MVYPFPLERVTLAGLLAGTAFVAFAGSAAAQQNDEQIARGETLALAGNCASCHTAPDGEPYAGGLPIDSPFGLLYSSNITPHETGIGNYTRDEFFASMRQGTNADGEPMYPAHPYPFYTKMTDEDVDALWAFLQTVEPVENEVEVVALPFPFNVRTGLQAWQAATFEPGRFEPDDSKSEQWNRGAYLVNAVTHCGACHTPRNAIYATEDEYHLEGAVIRGWYAPDISMGDSSAIDGWSEDELVHFLREGESFDLETSYGPMDTVVHGGLSKIPEDAVRAIAVYLQDVEPAEPKEVDLDVPNEFARVGNGERLFVTNCSGCHLRSGEGKPGAAPTLDDNESITTPEPNNPIMTMLNGLPPDEAWGGMPSYLNILNNNEIAQITNYVRTAWSNQAPINATPELVEDLRRESQDVPTWDPWDSMCANLPRSQVDEQLVETIGQVSQDRFTGQEIDELIQTYARRFPDVDAGTALIALSTGYCRHLAQGELDRDDALTRIGEFNSRVAAAIDTEMPSPGGGNN
jgi:mono/diheme cytochrome c family protein